MTILDIKETVANITKKGFEEQKGGKHRSFNYVTLDGKRSAITTHISRGSHYKVLPNNLISPMANQCHLSKQEFIDFAKCCMSQQEFELIQKQHGRL